MNCILVGLAGNNGARPLNDYLSTITLLN